MAYPSQLAQPSGSQPAAGECEYTMVSSGQRVKGGLLLSIIVVISDETDHL